MSNLSILNRFVQDVYLTRYNRYIDDITDEDGVVEKNKTISWANMFKDELEQETDNDGQPIDWNFARENDKELGTISSASQVVALPSRVKKLVYDSDRPLVIMFDGAIVSNWEVVNPNQITRGATTEYNQRVTVVNRNLVFSRPFDETEVGGTIVADVINEIPELAANDISLIEMVKPYSLLVLGVAKNATLPDIVQGGLSPSFTQKYADVLTQAKANNNASSTSDTVVRDDYSGIAGVF